MKIFRSLNAVPALPRKTALAIGNFDGLHLGHQKILRFLANEAGEKSLFSCVLTFSPHPEKIFGPEKIWMIQTLEQRLGGGFAERTRADINRGQWGIGVRGSGNTVETGNGKIAPNHETVLPQFAQRAEGDDIVVAHCRGRLRIHGQRLTDAIASALSRKRDVDDPPGCNRQIVLPHGPLIS